MPQTRAKLTTPRYRKRHSVGFMPVAPKRTRYTGILHRSRHSTAMEHKEHTQTLEDDLEYELLKI